MFKKRAPRKRQEDDDGDVEASSPAPLDDAKKRQKTFDRAVNLLAFKARSVSELRERLLEKEWATTKIVDEVIEKLKFYGYLDDEQFAKTFAASQIRQKPVGRRVLKQKLSMKKLDKETVETALEAALEETPEDEIIDRAIEKRLRLKGRPATREETKKFYDYLLRQGFSYDLVSDKMRALAANDFDDTTD